MATRKTTAKAPTTTSKAPKKAPVEPVKAQDQVQEQTEAMPTIRARIDRLADFEGSKVKAFASANIGGAFAIHGLRVVDGEKGLFVAMPSTSYQKDGKTEYQETFHPVSGDARKALNDAVLEAYEQKLTEEQTEDASMSMDEAEAQPITQTM
ncbi:MAG: SpoVG family protein [Clostridia bacterium]|nr:SpoVG family protein [Clostridia bacterium]